MNTAIERKKRQIERGIKRRRLWQRIVSGLAAMVMFATTYALILPAATQGKVFCDTAEHKHGVEAGCYVPVKRLNCTLAEQGHAHTEECIEPTKVLGCEVKDETHVHTDECYIEQSVYACGQEEAEEHTHTDGCYITMFELVCTTEEHTHSRACYADSSADIETAEQWERSVETVKLTGEWAKDVVEVAKSQLGYKESERNYIVSEENEIKGYSRYGDWIGEKYVDWSAAFVAFCLNYSGIGKERLPYDKSAEAWVKALKAQSLYNEGNVGLKEGDIVFIDEDGDNKADRVGIVAELMAEEKGEASPKIKTVEGDLNNAVSYAEHVLPAVAGDSRTNEGSSSENSNNSVAAGTPMGGDENINNEASADANAALHELSGDADQTNEASADAKAALHELSDDADQTNEASSNNAFAEAKATLGRTGREASQTPHIIGSVFLPENPDYVKPIDTLDPENPEATEAPESKKITLTATAENGVTVTLTASADAFDAPENELELYVKLVDDEEARELMENKAGANDTEEMSRSSLVFDIKVLHNGKELQPKTGVKVSFEGEAIPGGRLEAYHIDTNKGTAESMDAEHSDGRLSFDTPHFSFFGITGVKAHKSPAIPTLQGPINGPIAVRYEYAGGLVSETYYASLAEAMQFIGTKNYEFTIIFTQDYTGSANDWQYAHDVAHPKKINWTSTYNINGSQAGPFTLNMGVTPTLWRRTSGNATIYYHFLAADWEFFNIKLSGGYHYIHCYHDVSLTFGEGVETNFTNLALVAGYSGNSFAVNSKITVMSGTINWIWGANSIPMNGAANYGTLSGNVEINVGGTAVVYCLTAAGCYGTNAVTTTATRTINIDGTFGAKVDSLLYAYAAISANDRHQNGCLIEVNVKNANLEEINLYSPYGSPGYLPTGSTATLAQCQVHGRSKITFEGDCHVADWVYASYPLLNNQFDNEASTVELKEGAKLRLGGSADESVQARRGASWRDYSAQQGRIMSGGKLIMNANSKLILGPNTENVGWVYGIDVKGEGAEIDVFKSGDRSYPLFSYEAVNGTDVNKLKLGFYYDPHNPSNAPWNMTNGILNFASEPHAIEADYLPGEVLEGMANNIGNLNGVHKSGKYIVPCALLSDPIDIGIGHIVVGEEFTAGGSTVYNTVQYEGDSDSPYAHDHAVQPKYTLTGQNTDTSDWIYPKVCVFPERDITVELLLDGLDMVGNGAACFAVSNTNTTLTLLDNTETKMTSTVINGGFVPHPKNSALNLLGGGIEKNGYKGDLTIQCQYKSEHPGDTAHRCNDTCGKLSIDVSGAFHMPAIGSGLISPQHRLGKPWCVFYAVNNEGRYAISDFANLYILGGNITAIGADHTPAIGNVCSGSSITKNINISGANVTARAFGAGSTGIGSGWGGGAQDFYITGGAHVVAVGGPYSPGIGAGGTNTTSSLVQLLAYNHRLDNLVISGGDTVVEAFGGYAGSAMVPGIGVGPDYNLGDLSNRVTNIFADPLSGYVAIAKQAITQNYTNLQLARDAATFTPGAPSSSKLPLTLNQLYTLVYFSKIQKTASVGNGVKNEGTLNSPVAVNEGDTVKYIISTSDIRDRDGIVSGSVVDELPEGMTFAGSPSPAAGFSYSYNDTTKRYTVRWDNVSFDVEHEFSVNVTVDSLPFGVTRRDFQNSAKLFFLNTQGTQEIQLNSNLTYHRVEKPQVSLTVTKRLVGSGTGPFDFELTVVDQNGDPVKLPEDTAASPAWTVGAAAPYTVSFSLAKDESVTLPGIPVGSTVKLTELTHSGYTVIMNRIETNNGGSGGTSTTTVLLGTGNERQLSMTEDMVVEVVNNSGTILPNTGGSGTLPFTLGGSLITATALMYALVLRRRREGGRGE